jgi:hypothetical protein
MYKKLNGYIDGDLTAEIELSMSAGTTEHRRVADFPLARSHAFLTL